MTVSDQLHFMDTSAFVKLFLTEAGSLAMTEFALAEPDENKIICALAAVEARSALVKLGRMGRLEQDQIRLALSILSEELLRLQVQAITPLVISKASDLVERHELRALDALQLARRYSSATRISLAPCGLSHLTSIC